MELFLERSRLLLRKVKGLRILIPHRNRYKEKWAATRPKYPATTLALQHFDDRYGSELGPLWPSVRVALLSEKKYGALLNIFCSDASLEELQAQGCRDFIQDKEAQTPFEHTSDGGAQNESSHVSPTEAEAESLQPPPPQFSPNLQCFVFQRGDITRFKPPKPDQFGLLGYYLMDAASVLPCLALDVKKGDAVLDLCAAPGGKSLVLLQTQVMMSAGFICVNDLSASRIKRLKQVLHSYIPKQFLTDNKLRVTNVDGTLWGDEERSSFDKVLVDVPCTTDRHSLMEDDNNIFSKSRTGERRMLPQLQLQLLLSGIQTTCPGGEIVYSTCTLCQNQNQSVVEKAIHLAEENHNIQLEVVSLRPLVEMFRNTFHFAPDLHLGEMVIPHLAANFGPIYLCKLRRLS
ncbi:5-cytosine rRNA methyltransferase NSUN4 [Austrofundulus limnaeus]|uniref:5-cytosine rRNA methyltransferase NSUN4 n=1 Tax=Austrofundulus limnaeus TaxID=52670 RepID=A0A2I4AHE9_AUSLI|nr:PREDICTED: 5-methylcytosine rRNA methyltransferase NSUN4 [Austrofundulus limnaeus]